MVGVQGVSRGGGGPGVSRGDGGPGVSRGGWVGVTGVWE